MFFISKKYFDKRIKELFLKFDRIEKETNSIYNQKLLNLIWKSFINGLFKGLGAGIGFTFLGAILLIILRKVVVYNIPIIGKYLKDILDIIENP